MNKKLLDVTAHYGTPLVVMMTNWFCIWRKN